MVNDILETLKEIDALEHLSDETLLSMAQDIFWDLVQKGWALPSYA